MMMDIYKGETLYSAKLYKGEDGKLKKPVNQKDIINSPKEYFLNNSKGVIAMKVPKDYVILDIDIKDNNSDHISLIGRYVRYIKDNGLKTLIIKTNNGYHIYFKKPSSNIVANGVVTPIPTKSNELLIPFAGMTIEYKTEGSCVHIPIDDPLCTNTYIKQRQVLYKSVENLSELSEMPLVFGTMIGAISSKGDKWSKTKEWLNYDGLHEYVDGNGREETLFKLVGKLCEYGLEQGLIQDVIKIVGEYSFLEGCSKQTIMQKIERIPDLLEDNKITDLTDENKAIDDIFSTEDKKITEEEFNDHMNKLRGKIEKEEKVYFIKDFNGDPIKFECLKKDYKAVFRNLATGVIMRDKKLYFYNHSFYIKDGYIMKPVSVQMIKSYITELITVHNSQTTTHNDVNFLVENLKVHCNLVDDGDYYRLFNGELIKKTNQDYISLKNGRYNLSNRVFEENHDYIDFSTIPVNLITTDELDHEFYKKYIVGYINEISLGREDVIESINRFLATVFMKSHEKLQYIFFLYGPGGSGKSNLMNFLCNMLGSALSSNVKYDGFLSDFGLVPIENSLLNNGGELPKGTLKPAFLDKIKGISGGDPIGINKKGINIEYEKKIEATLVFNANDFTGVAEAKMQKGMDRRIIGIPFDRDFENTNYVVPMEMFNDEKFKKHFMYYIINVCIPELIEGKFKIRHLEKQVSEEYRPTSTIGKLFEVYSREFETVSEEEKLNLFLDISRGLSFKSWIDYIKTYSIPIANPQGTIQVMLANNNIGMTSARVRGCHIVSYGIDGDLVWDQEKEGIQRKYISPKPENPQYYNGQNVIIKRIQDYLILKNGGDINE